MTAEQADRPKIYVIEQARYSTGDVAGFSMGPDGKTLHTHMSSSPGWLQHDTTEGFGRGAALRERFGDFDVVYVSMSDELPDEIAHYFKPGEEQDR